MTKWFVPLFFETFVNFPLGVISYDFVVDETTKIEPFRSKLHVGDGGDDPECVDERLRLLYRESTIDRKRHFRRKRRPSRSVLMISTIHRLTTLGEAKDRRDQRSSWYSSSHIHTNRQIYQV